MEQEDFQKFLKDKYYPELHQAQQRALYHQRFTKWSEWGLIIFSGITTILLAISSFLNGLPIVPLTAICSAFVTIIAATMKSLKTQEKWSFYQKLSSDLDNEYYLYRAQERIYQKFAHCGSRAGAGRILPAPALAIMVYEWLCGHPQKARADQVRCYHRSWPADTRCSVPFS